MDERSIIAVPPDELTDREWEVLELVVVGKRNKEIAEELCLSVLTVQNHLHHIYRKLGVTSRTQAALHPIARALQEK